MKDEELLRYSRQVMLPEIEIAGQEKLLASRVLIIGLGGLGSPIALYLAAAGVGHLLIADDDKVELSNLQRQIIHGTKNIGQYKTDSAIESILDLNPNTRVTNVDTRFTAASLKEAAKDIDLIIDATDNFESRVVINRVSIETKTPVIYGAAIRLEGQILVYDAKDDSPCYECLYRNMDDKQLNCAENGVAAPIVGIIGTMQAMEAIRLLVGIGESAAGYLHVFDGKEMNWQKLKLPKSPNCPSCH
ncbi:MAG: molybdopterin/thiamine biosynthesis adenylyltransferase [Candidatus Azotimanducaceae bacterium]|jgi:molybdopterin/thiamine biosynthesis adenylyltransferase